MLPDQIVSMILDEQSRQGGNFIQGVDVNSYLTKLGEKAEIVADFLGGRCRGFVAFYCNDMNSKKAFITLVLVDPRDRGLGLGQALVDFVFNVARHRGFEVCQLEVRKSNQAAYKLYLAKGFRLLEERGDIYLMEARL